MTTAIREVTPYEDHRDYVLRVLAWRASWLAPSDREAILHEAYTVFLEKQRDGALDVGSMRPAQVRAYLVQTALNKALDEGKRAGRKRSVPLEHSSEGEFPDATAPLDELLAARLDAQRVREIVCELPERQQLVIKLRYFFERSPEEIQRHLGLSERTYRRLLERAMRTLAERYALVTEGTFCESRRSLITVWLEGVATPKQAARVHRHLALCPACAHWAAEQRLARVSPAGADEVRSIA
jgi:RNA polymerase sigma factor (sigma-70 family)